MVKKTTVFWLLGIVPERSDSLQGGWGAKPPEWGAEKYLVRVRTAMAGHGRPWQSVPIPGISQLPKEYNRISGSHEIAGYECGSLQGHYTLYIPDRL